MLEGKLFQPSILTLGHSATRLFSYSTGNRFDPPMVFATVNKCIASDVIAVVVSIALDLLCIATDGLPYSVLMSYHVIVLSQLMKSLELD